MKKNATTDMIAGRKANAMSAECTMSNAPQSDQPPAGASVRRLVRQIIERLERDITDRRGLKHEWEAIDADIMDEDLKPEWERLITVEINAFLANGKMRLAEARRIAEALEAKDSSGTREEIERLRGIVLACHRSFIGGSPFIRQVARRLVAEEIAEMDRRAKSNANVRVMPSPSEGDGGKDLL